MRAIVDNAKWLTAYAVAIYWGASFFTEQDGTWHMTVIRDTDFTPSHIIDVYKRQQLPWRILNVTWHPRCPSLQ